jgi:hypothetical protein
MPAAATGADGWIFKPEEMILRADSVGTDDDGRTYYSY